MSSNKFFGSSEGAGVEIELGVDGDGHVESEFLTKEFCKWS